MAINDTIKSQGVSTILQLVLFSLGLIVVYGRMDGLN